MDSLRNIGGKKLKSGLLITAAILFPILMFSGCKAIKDAVNDTMKGGIQPGSWSDDGRVFTNEWAGIKFNLPETYHALSSEELQAAVGAGEDIMVNDGDFNKFAVEAAKMRTVYDFMVLTDTGLPNAMLMYENIGIQPLLKNLDAEGYFEEIKMQMESLESMEYEFVSTDKKTIAGEEWFVGTMSFAGGIAYQNYYLRKIDNIIMGLITTYTTETEGSMNEFIGAIKKS